VDWLEAVPPQTKTALGWTHNAARYEPGGIVEREGSHYRFLQHINLNPMSLALD